jgi:hypothetical protein
VGLKVGSRVMEKSSHGFIVHKGLYYPEIVKEIKKSGEQLQPVYEAFTNAFEAIKQSNMSMAEGQIKIELYQRKNTAADENHIFDKITVHDNGVGFDQENFDRFNRYKDTRKNFFNKGSGRIQFLHFFNTTRFRSTFSENGELKSRAFSLSKQYMGKGAIVKDEGTEKAADGIIGTVVSFEKPLKENDESFYGRLTAQGLKKSLISHYMMEFCNFRSELPQINIFHHLDNSCTTVSISSQDIPPTDEVLPLTLSLYKMSPEFTEPVKTGSFESVYCTAFKIDKGELEKNGIKLTCKGEIAPKPKIDLEGLSQRDQIEGKRYLFLLSGEYFDKHNNDPRGEIEIPTRDLLKKQSSETQQLFESETLILDEIQEKANDAILSHYDEIRTRKEEQKKNTQALKEMFLLNDETMKSMRFGLDDSDERILEKVYTADVKIAAKKDAEIKRAVDSLDNLDPTSDSYRNSLNSIVNELVKAIPRQNKVALTRYVARRKLILNLFEKILKQELSVQNLEKSNADESLLHNLIFQKSSDDSRSSDLWLINEDFIYFDGISEEKLNNAKIKGKKLFKKEFSKEEEKILKAAGRNRKINRPDILLFPGESKCIIIEFKNPNVDVSEYLTQINKYASLIRNFTEPDFNLDTFYGYLIGEDIEVFDVQFNDSDFLDAYHFDYLYRPYKRIIGTDGRGNGSLYTEVIKYSTLLKRASQRNEVFIRNLTGRI